MKNNIKRVLAFALCLVMVIGLLPATATHVHVHAAEATGTEADPIALSVTVKQFTAPEGVRLALNSAAKISDRSDNSAGAIFSSDSYMSAWEYYCAGYDKRDTPHAFPNYAYVSIKGGHSTGYASYEGYSDTTDCIHPSIPTSLAGDYTYQMRVKKDGASDYTYYTVNLKVQSSFFVLREGVTVMLDNRTYRSSDRTTGEAADRKAKDLQIYGSVMERVKQQVIMTQEMNLPADWDLSKVTVQWFAKGYVTPNVNPRNDFDYWNYFAGDGDGARVWPGIGEFFKIDGNERTETVKFSYPNKGEATVKVTFRKYEQAPTGSFDFSGGDIYAVFAGDTDNVDADAMEQGIRNQYITDQSPEYMINDIQLTYKYSDGNYYSLNGKDAAGNQIVPGMNKAGSYTVRAYWPGDDTFGAITKEATINVIDARPKPVIKLPTEVDMVLNDQGEMDVEATKAAIEAATTVNANIYDNNGNVTGSFNLYLTDTTFVYQDDFVADFADDDKVYVTASRPGDGRYKSLDEVQEWITIKDTRAKDSKIVLGKSGALEIPLTYNNGEISTDYAAAILSALGTAEAQDAADGTKLADLTKDNITVGTVEAGKATTASISWGGDETHKASSTTVTVTFKDARQPASLTVNTAVDLVFTAEGVVDEEATKAAIVTADDSWTVEFTGAFADGETVTVEASKAATDTTAATEITETVTLTDARATGSVTFDAIGTVQAIFAADGSVDNDATKAAVIAAAKAKAALTGLTEGDVTYTAGSIDADGSMTVTAAWGNNANMKPGEATVAVKVNTDKLEAEIVCANSVSIDLVFNDKGEPTNKTAAAVFAALGNVKVVAKAGGSELAVLTAADVKLSDDKGTATISWAGDKDYAPTSFDVAVTYNDNRTEAELSINTDVALVYDEDGKLNENATKAAIVTADDSWTVEFTGEFADGAEITVTATRKADADHTETTITKTVKLTDSREASAAELTANSIELSFNDDGTIATTAENIEALVKVNGAAADASWLTVSDIKAGDITVAVKFPGNASRKALETALTVKAVDARTEAELTIPEAVDLVFKADGTVDVDATKAAIVSAEGWVATFQGTFKDGGTVRVSATYAADGSHTDTTITKMVTLKDNRAVSVLSLADSDAVEVVFDTEANDGTVDFDTTRAAVKAKVLINGEAVDAAYMNVWGALTGGTAVVEVNWPGDADNKPIKGETINVSTTDARPQPVIAINAVGEVLIDFYDDSDAIKAKVLAAAEKAGASVTLPERSALDAEIIWTVKSIADGSATVVASVNETASYKSASAETTVSLKIDQELTSIVLKSGVTVPYGTTADEILALIVDMDASVLPEGAELTIEISSLDAGTQTVTVSFAGDGSNAPSMAEGTVSIKQGSIGLTMDSKRIIREEDAMPVLYTVTDAEGNAIDALVAMMYAGITIDGTVDVYMDLPADGGDSETLKNALAMLAQADLSLDDGFTLTDLYNKAVEAGEATGTDAMTVLKGMMAQLLGDMEPEEALQRMADKVMEIADEHLTGEQKELAKKLADKLLDTAKSLLNENSDKLLELGDYIRFKSGTPEGLAGIYATAAVECDDNYACDPKFDVGVLVIQRHEAIKVEVDNRYIEYPNTLTESMVSTDRENADLYTIYVGATANGPMVYLEGVNEAAGSTVGELRQLLAENPEFLTENLGLDREIFQVIVSEIASRLPDYADSIPVNYGMPTLSGIYEVTAIAYEAGYGYGIGFGGLIQALRTLDIAVKDDAVINCDDEVSDLITLDAEDANSYALYINNDDKVIYIDGVEFDAYTLPELQDALAAEAGKILLALGVDSEMLTELLEKALSSDPEEVYAMLSEKTGIAVDKLKEYISVEQIKEYIDKDQLKEYIDKIFAKVDVSGILNKLGIDYDAILEQAQAKIDKEQLKEQMVRLVAIAKAIRAVDVNEWSIRYGSPMAYNEITAPKPVRVPGEYVVLAFAGGEGYIPDLGLGSVTVGPDHMLTIWHEAVEPTCTEDGSIEYWSCENCGKHFSDYAATTEITLDETMIEALGHDYQAGETVAPTCTEQGYTVYVCARDENHPVEHRDFVPATGHTDGRHETIEDSVVSPSCTEDGSHDENVYCSVCGELIRTDHVTDRATGHTDGRHETIEDSIVPPSCTESGSHDENVYCSVCGELIRTDHVTDRATGHTPGETEFENETAATCTTPGRYDIVVHCTVCGNVISRTRIVIPATGHRHTEVRDRVEPTAFEDGYTGDTWCTDCNTLIIRGQVIPCGHTYAASTVVAPTCEEYGYTVYTCTEHEDCGFSYNDNYVEPLGHNYIPTVVAPTCEDGGYTVHVCANDASHTYTDSETAALGHDYHAARVVAPTCTEQGYTVYVCANDASHNYNDDFVAATGHQHTHVEGAVDATTTTPGYTGDTVCDECGTVLEYGEVIPVTRPNPPVNPNPPVTDIDDEEVPLAGGNDLNRTDHFAYIFGYADGTIRPENNISRQETAAIFYRIMTELAQTIYGTDENSFTDVDSDLWSNHSISTLVNADIISGYPDGTFRPTKDITRAEFVTMAVRFFEMTTGNEITFSDVEGHWAAEQIAFAASQGWINGYEDGTFRPDDAISRAEAMQIINGILNRQVDETGMLDGAQQYADVVKTKWYYYAVMEAATGHNYERRGDSADMENWTELVND